MNNLSEPVLNPRETALVYFSPEDYLIGRALKALAAGRDVRIAAASGAAVSIFPGRRAYCASVVDPAFCRLPAARLEVTPLGEAEGAMLRSTLPLRNVDELLWLAAFHAAQGRLVDGLDGMRLHLNDVIEFAHWPNLSRLPATPNTMRICALLTREPSSIFLIPRKLGIPAEEVFQVCSAAHCSGVVRVLNHAAMPRPEGKPGRPAPRDLVQAMLERLSHL